MYMYCRSNSFHVNTQQLGVGRRWWLDYPGSLLDVELESIYLFVKYVRPIVLFLHYFDSTQSLSCLGSLLEEHLYT